MNKIFINKHSEEQESTALTTRSNELTFRPDHDGIKGIGLIFPPETTVKLKEIYEATVFTHWRLASHFPSFY